MSVIEPNLKHSHVLSCVVLRCFALRSDVEGNAEPSQSLPILTFVFYSAKVLKILSLSLSRIPLH